MTSQQGKAALRAYVRAISDTRSGGQATEHSYRPFLKTLIETLGGEGTTALNEPAQVECGAPDFIVERSGVPIGHVECKDVSGNLEELQETEQIKRYRDGLPNLVLTNYVEFRWYVDGEPRDEAARAGRSDGQGVVKYDGGGASEVADLLEAFLDADAPVVDNSRDLSQVS